MRVRAVWGGEAEQLLGNDSRVAYTHLLRDCADSCQGGDRSRALCVKARGEGVFSCFGMHYDGIKAGSEAQVRKYA